MNPDFVAACTSIAPLVGDTGECIHMDIPGVDEARVREVADAVAGQSREGLVEMLATRDTAYVLTCLQIADFTGHDALIDASAAAIAARLEGASRLEMQRVLDLEIDTISETAHGSEIRRDLAWISKYRSRLV